MQQLEIQLNGLEPDAMGGIHIHEGFTCETSDGHYWTPASDDDPWIAVKWTSNNGGSATQVLTVDSGYDLVDSIGHAVVVHESSGTRVACGVIGKSPCEAFCDLNLLVCSGTDAAYADLETCELECQNWVGPSPIYLIFGVKQSLIHLFSRISVPVVRPEQRVKTASPVVSTQLPLPMKTMRRETP